MGYDKDENRLVLAQIKGSLKAAGIEG